MSEFKITGPGEYRTRGGLMAVVEPKSKNLADFYGFIVGKSGHITWYSNGTTIGHDRENDIIGPWVEPDIDKQKEDITTEINRHLYGDDGLASEPVQPQHGAGEPVKTLRDEAALAVFPILIAEMLKVADRCERSGISGPKIHESASIEAFMAADAFMAARQKGGAV